ARACKPPGCWKRAASRKRRRCSRRCSGSLLLRGLGVAKLRFDLKKLAPVTVAVLSAAVAMAAVTYISFVNQAEQFIRDLETASLSRPEPQSTDITIVTINEQTLKLFPYREPIDRKFLADLLNKLAEWKPRVIALDV